MLVVHSQVAFGFGGVVLLDGEELLSVSSNSLLVGNSSQLVLFSERSILRPSIRVFVTVLARKKCSND